MGGPDEVGRTLNRLGIFYHDQQKLSVYLVIEGINLIIFIAYPSCRFNVSVHKGLHASLKHGETLLSHPGYVNERFNQRILSNGDIDLGNPFGMVPYPLKVCNNI